MNLESKIEALLFWKAEPVSVARLAATLGAEKAEVEAALASLSVSLSGRGIALALHDGEAELRTAPDASSLIEKLTKEELMRDLGKAGLETLSIILYRHPIKRSEIDYIRGVNSSFILRNLLMRGLVERVTERGGEDGKVGRGYAYKPTLDLLSHLGVAKLEDLPDYASVRSELAAFESSQKEQEAQPENASQTAEPAAQ